MGLRVFVRRLRDWLWVAAQFYGDRIYRRADLGLRLRYGVRGPYIACKNYCITQGEYNPYQYGETPLKTLAQLVSRFGITSKDTVYELGCGPGYTGLWLHRVIGCRVVGIDRVPLFIKRGIAMSKRYRLQGLEFRCQDITTVDYRHATFVYLYGTCLDDSVIKQLIASFATLPQGAKIMTVSYPLSEYCTHGFHLLDRLQGHYTWGRADVYLQSKN